MLAREVQWSKANYKLIHTDNRCDHSYSFPFVFDRISFTLILLNFYVFYYICIYFIILKFKIRIEAMQRQDDVDVERTSYRWAYFFFHFFTFKQHENKDPNKNAIFFSSLLFLLVLCECMVHARNRVVNHYFGRLMWVSGFSFSFAWLATIIIRRIYIYYVCWFLSQFVLFFFICSVNFISLNCTFVGYIHVRQFISHNVDNKHLLIERTVKEIKVCA